MRGYYAFSYFDFFSMYFGAEMIEMSPFGRSATYMRTRWTKSRSSGLIALLNPSSTTSELRRLAGCSG